MGLQSKITSDAALAKDHDAGATVSVIQVMEHAQLGTIEFPWQARLWAHHHHAAADGYESLKVALSALVNFEVKADGMRSVRDHDYLRQVYLTGSAFVINACLVIQHLCLEIERTTQTPTLDGPLVERLRACATTTGLLGVTQGTGYDALVQVIKVRDAIEHPKSENTYHGAPDGGWDRVPLAWFLSERSLITFETYFAWFDRVHDAWAAWVAAQPARPVTLDVDGRGLRSERQFKKPPDSRLGSERNGSESP